jgi:hypothetical protein
MPEPAKVFQDRLSPGDWRVEWEDDDGGVEVTILSGPDARESRRGAARRFLEGAPQRPSTGLVHRLLDGADVLDDIPGLFRPVTLNMLGLALQNSDQVLIG